MTTLLVILALSVSVTNAAPDQDRSSGDCPFCRTGWFRAGSVALPGFDPPPATSNLFSSLILDQSEHFVLKVTRGAFVPFYFLVVSKAHRLRIADLGPVEMADLVRFTTHVEGFFREVLDRPFVAFEHGPLRQVGGGGCVDHLHLHLLPFAGEIETAPDLRLRTRFDEPRTIDGLASLAAADVRARPYVYYRTPAGVARLYAVRDGIPSQLLRLLIAEASGLDEEYDWRAFEARGDFWGNSAQSVAAYLAWRHDGAVVARQKTASKGWDVRVPGDAPRICSTALGGLRWHSGP